MVNTEAWTPKATLDARSLAMRRPTFYAKHASKVSGFTLTELMVSVGIVGILSAIALPNYSNAINKSRQAETANLIAQIQNTIQAYREEYLENPAGWSDLGRITPIATNSGPAAGSSFATPITTPNGEHYSLTGSGTDIINITATPIRINPNWSIASCINTTTGYSDIQRGNGSEAPGVTNCGGGGT